MLRFLAPLPFLVLALMGCSGNGEPAADLPRLLFVRDGVVLDPPPDSPPLEEGAWKTPEGPPPKQIHLGQRALWLDLPWKPGETVSLRGPGGKDLTGVAPARPTAFSVMQLDLTDVSQRILAGSPEPDSALTFSRDGSALAVGTSTGDLLVVDPFAGKVTWKRHIAEGFIRQMAFSPDGKRLYAGEQGPDGSLHAFDALTGTPVWKVDFADDLERSPPPSPDDVYGAYSLPGIYRIVVTPDGRILVIGLHSWADKDGNRKNRSRLYAYNDKGNRILAFPEDGPADLNFTWLATDRAGAQGLLGVIHTGDGKPRSSLPAGGILALNLRTFTSSWWAKFSPLLPWYQNVFLWQAVALSDDGSRALAGLSDGRIFLFDGAPRPGENPRQPLRTLSPGAPVVTGGVPIAATIGFALYREQNAYVVISQTTVPYSAGSTASDPPSAHPGANTLLALDAGGEERWRYHGAFAMVGISAAEDGAVVAVGAGPRDGDDRRDLYGILLFDGKRPSGTGEQRLLAWHSTEGPVFFHHAVHPRGTLVAAVEVPTRSRSGGEIIGGYRLHIVH